MTLSIVHYAECRILFIVMLNVVMLSDVLLSVIKLSVVMLSVVEPYLACHLEAKFECKLWGCIHNT